MNPFGAIPVLKDSDGPGGKPVLISQSTAILLYCAEKAGRHLPQDPAARPAMLEALMRASTDVTPMFGAVTLASRMKEPHPATVAEFKARLQGQFKTWDGILAAQRYAAGAELTIADLSLYAGYWRTKGAVPELVAGLPDLERWAAEMAARPAIQRAVKL
jgi:glutathione S-transferase